MRLHELHPAIVHLPIALAPAALAADLTAVRAGRSDRAGAWLLAGSAAGAACAVLSGFVAQPAVETPEGAHDQLITHRTLNLVATVALGAATLVRMRSRRARAGHLFLEAGATALLAYTGYLGGRMVYAHGVGVHGVREEKSPRLILRALPSVMTAAGRNIGHAVRHAWKHAREGKLIPAALPAKSPSASSVGANAGG